MKRTCPLWCLVGIFQILLLCGCADHALKRSIKAYRGDGEIRYLEAPLLGISGCAIQMPKIDLSRPVCAQYDFTGIPPGKHYVVYLVVPEPCPLTNVLQGIYSLMITRNGATFSAWESMLKNMGDERGGCGYGAYDENRFYFDSSDLTRQYAINVSDSTSRWSMVVSYTNAVLKEPIEAYILITRGGYK